MERKASVVVLINCYEPGEKGTVWLVPGDYAPGDDEPLPDELERAVRIVGPMELQDCPPVVDGLKRALTALGIEVTEHVFADD